MAETKLSFKYRDRMIWVLEKPEGLDTYGTAQKPGFKEAIEDATNQRLFPIHRLDAATSGLVAYALDSKSAALFSALFSGREIQKVYLAIVQGTITAPGRCTAPLFHKGKKTSALTEFYPIRSGVFLHKNSTAPRTTIPRTTIPTTATPATLVEVHPKTGRFHQIRKHFAGLGHPLLGDPTAKTELLAPRLMLHANELYFEHPKLKRKLSIFSKSPSTFKVSKPHHK